MARPPPGSLRGSPRQGEVPRVHKDGANYLIRVGLGERAGREASHRVTHDHVRTTHPRFAQGLVQVIGEPPGVNGLGWGLAPAVAGTIVGHHPSMFRDLGLHPAPLEGGALGAGVEEHRRRAIAPLARDVQVETVAADIHHLARRRVAAAVDPRGHHLVDDAEGQQQDGRPQQGDDPDPGPARRTTISSSLDHNAPTSPVAGCPCPQDTPSGYVTNRSGVLFRMGREEYLRDRGWRRSSRDRADEHPRQRSSRERGRRRSFARIGHLTRKFHPVSLNS